MDNFNQVQTHQQQSNETVSLGEWLLTYLILIIPLVNIIMVFIWAFGSNVKPSKQNFFRAYLIVMLISIVLVIAVSILFGAAFATLIQSAPSAQQLINSNI